MIAASTFLQQEGYLVTILGFVALMLAPYGAAFYQSRKVVKKLGEPNGEGNSLFDVGQNAAVHAKAAKDLLEENFTEVFRRLDAQDRAIANLQSRSGGEALGT